MDWWIWLIIGLVLLGTEIFLPLDFFLFFIGLAFITSGTISSLGITNDPSILFTITGIASVVYLVTLRPLIRKKFVRINKNVSDIQGQEVEITSEIAPGKTGSGSMRGSTWQVRNKTNVVLKEGSTQTISSIDGLVLIIE
jgi:membrane protein implicated in regulation of membrane protease activity